MDRRRSCLSRWFPKLEAGGIPVPKTAIVHAHIETCGAMSALLSGESITKADRASIDALVAEIRSAAETLPAKSGEAGTYPVFLRTGQTSAKHWWKDTCFVPNAAAIPSHMARIVEFSEVCDLFGLPFNVWVVREFLPLEYSFTAFRDMPIAIEFRCFIRYGHVECIHPYWPEPSIKEARWPGIGNTEPQAAEDWQWQAVLAKQSEMTPERHKQVESLAQRVAAIFANDGWWSVDLCLVKGRGWMVTDMADGASSFHWAGCSYAGADHES